MTTITIDCSTGDMLRRVTGPVELRDERGLLVGEFRPATDRDAVGREPFEDRASKQRGLAKMLERMRQASVQPGAFPITREALHERR